MRVHQFAAIRAPAHRVSEVSCPPYDVVDRVQALGLAQAKPNSFIRVVRSEVDLGPEQNPYSAAVYDRASENLESLLERGYLIRDSEPRMYVYRQSKGGRRQAGLVCSVDVEAYRAGDIRRHELTRPDKEQDRTDHIVRLQAHTESVLLTVADQPELVRQLSRDMNDRPLLHFAAKDGVTHTLWLVHDYAKYDSIFASVGRLYIADGHHRSAAALRAAERFDGARDPESQRFPAVIYPSEELLILPYHRLVRLCGTMTSAQVLSALGGIGSLSAIADPGDPLPRTRGFVAIYADSAWWSLRLPSPSRDSPLDTLDVSVVSRQLLAPILGIHDERADERLSFLGGCTAAELAAAVDEGRADIAFAMHATSINELLAVADQGLIMPPKSTWFDPKIRSGLFIHGFGARSAG
ncbi:MAG: DUF1015 domain-containing protein [Phycisphaerales bacterium]|nr:DUF1015 domain-containing protein [Phycisphaerales bacterium]